MRTSLSLRGRGDQPPVIGPPVSSSRGGLKFQHCVYPFTIKVILRSGPITDPKVLVRDLMPTFELSGRPDRACPLERIVWRRRAFHFCSKDFLVAGQ